MTRKNMSNVVNKGVKIHCKAVRANFFTVMGLLVELITYTVKPKGSIE